MAEATLIVWTDDKGAETVGKVIETEGGSPGIISQQKNIAGEVAAVLVAVTAFTQALPALLQAMKELIQLGRVSKVKVGDVEIDNPTQEMVERLLTERLGAPS